MAQGIYPIQESPLNLSKTLSEMVADRYTRAQAMAQEQKNPYIGQRELEALIADKLKNKWYEPNIRSEIGLRGAQAGHLGEETTNLRYQREHGLLETPLVQNIKYALELAKQKREQEQLAQQNRIPDINVPSASSPALSMEGNASPLQNSLYSLINNQSQGLNQIPSSAEIQNIQPRQTQSALANDMGIPMTGDPLADAMIRHSLGISSTKETDPSLVSYREQAVENMKSKLKSEAFKSLPKVEKDYELAQAHSLGYTFSNASREFLNGKSLEDLAQEKGYDPKKPETWPLPAPPPTSTVITQQQRANIARAAVSAIEPIISKNLAGFSYKIGDVSPKLIMDQLQGKNKEQQAAAIASAFVANELNVLQSRGANIQNVGIGLIRLLNDKNNNNLKIMKAALDPDVYQKSQDLIREYGNIINSAENQEMWGRYRESENAKQQNPSQGAGSVQNEFSGMTDEQLRAIAEGRA